MQEAIGDMPEIYRCFHNAFFRKSTTIFHLFWLTLALI